MVIPILHLFDYIMDLPKFMMTIMGEFIENTQA